MNICVVLKPFDSMTRQPWLCKTTDHYRLMPYVTYIFCFPEVPVKKKKVNHCVLYHNTTEISFTTSSSDTWCKNRASCKWWTHVVLMQPKWMASNCLMSVSIFKTYREVLCCEFILRNLGGHKLHENSPLLLAPPCRTSESLAVFEFSF